MKTYTKGPWKVQQLEVDHNGYGDWPTFIVRCEKTNVALAEVGIIDHYDSGRNPNNAHLIAAAPDLLEALQSLAETASGMLTAFQEYRPGAGYAVQQDLNKAVAAITKALQCA